MSKTVFEIYSGSGQNVFKGSFEGQTETISLDLEPGMYFVKYLDSNGVYQYTKAIKIK
jgi:hypothetical protein